jgi:hypothetical protein
MSAPIAAAPRPKSCRLRDITAFQLQQQKRQQQPPVAVAALHHLQSSEDVMFTILGCLTALSDLGACSCVCRRWHALADADIVWKARCIKKLPLAAALRERRELQQAGAAPTYKQLLAQKVASEAAHDDAEDQEEPTAPRRSQYLIVSERCCHPVSHDLHCCRSRSPCIHVFLSHGHGVLARAQGVEVSNLVAEESETEEEEEYDEAEIRAMTSEELREYMASLGIPTGGSKFDLQSRLAQYQDGREATDWLREGGQPADPAAAAAAAAAEAAAEAAEDAGAGSSKVLFCALRELSEVTRKKPSSRKPEPHVLAKVTGGATGEALRISGDDSADPGGDSEGFYSAFSTDYHVDPHFHLNIYLIRKRDGKRLSLISKTSREVDEVGGWLGGKPRNDGVGRQADWYMETYGTDKRTGYTWLLPGTGPSTGGDIPVELPAARLVADVLHKFRSAPGVSSGHAQPVNDAQLVNDLDAALQRPQTDLADFDGDEERRAAWQREHTWVDLVVTDFDLWLDTDEEHDAAVVDTVDELLQLIEHGSYACRWVGL